MSIKSGQGEKFCLVFLFKTGLNLRSLVRQGKKSQ